MKKQTFILFLFMTFISGCQIATSPGHIPGVSENPGDNRELQLPGSDQDKPDEPQLFLSFEEVRSLVLEPYCTTCHKSYTDYQNVIEDLSSIRSSIDSGFMPMRNTLPEELKAGILVWIDAGAPESGIVN